MLAGLRVLKKSRLQLSYALADDLPNVMCDIATFDTLFSTSPTFYPEREHCHREYALFNIPHVLPPRGNTATVNTLFRHGPTRGWAFATLSLWIKIACPAADSCGLAVFRLALSSEHEEAPFYWPALVAVKICICVFARSSWTPRLMFSPRRAWHFLTLNSWRNLP